MKNELPLDKQKGNPIIVSRPDCGHTFMLYI